MSDLCAIRCPRCGDTKPPDEFGINRSKRSGKQSYCRLCTLSVDRARRRANHEKVRVINRRSYQRHRPARIADVKEYAAKYPERIAAKAAIKAAIQAGDLIRGSCFACLSTENVQGHHEDYSKPFDVIWFCSSCHRTYHRFMERLENGGPNE